MNAKNASLLLWVLVETSHPGNVGSAARALKTMGFDDLRLVNPKTQGVAQLPEAIALASGAGDLLAKAHESTSLDSTVAGCSLVLGLTSRDREFGPPTLNWEEARALIKQTLSWLRLNWFYKTRYCYWLSFRPIRARNLRVKSIQ